MKVYLIERPKGTLITSGITTTKCVRLLGVNRCFLPAVNESKEIKGYHVEAFRIENDEESEEAENE